MSVKKILVLSAAALVAMGATAAMAGGPDHMAMPSEPAFQNSIYLEGHFGWAQSDWVNFNGSNLVGVGGSSTYAPSAKGFGYMTAAADLGYNITQHIAVEGGYFYLPSVCADSTSVTAGVSGTAKVNSWFAYTAAKFSVPVMDNLDLFGKMGVAYRALSYSLSGTRTAAINSVAGNGSYWAPVFGAGIQYLWNSWIIGGQYTYLPGNSSVNPSSTSFGAPNAAPEVNLYTGFLGYKFNV
ncbi:MAG: hypothetical protein NTZ67_06160 [Gammaproteobacteria bacterium]|nr:hypothetical protein [Gammaproteobacteria bacterium]